MTPMPAEHDPVSAYVSAVPGFAHGLDLPSLAVQLRIGAAVDAAVLETFDRFLNAALHAPAASFKSEDTVGDAADAQALGKVLLGWLYRLQIAAGVPVFEPGHVPVGSSSGRQAFMVVPAPVRAQQATARALQGLIRAVNALIAGKELVDIESTLLGWVKALQSAAPGASNVPHFLKAAHKLGLPRLELPGRVYQYGYGLRGRWLDSSFTDETSNISARLARDKALTAVVLRQSGIPVPQHRLVHDTEAAIAVANSLGYPVVVKPADRDGGTGVAAGLMTPQEVTAAFKVAKQHSNSLLVEKHFEGRDYRLTVFQGEVIWTIERVPGGVTGDGDSSVEQLVEKVNADPRRGQGRHAPLKRLALDDEARALLQRAGMDEHGVPPAGVFVRLRRTANVATGGTPVAVHDQLHPDNRLLAVRAAAALRLDLAGVDLLIPDIGRSWKKTGAVVCEVNGQPSLGQITAAHLPAQILKRLVPGNGRIPITVVLGAAPDSMLAAELAHSLEKSGLDTGFHDSRGVTVKGERVLDGAVGTFVGGRMLMLDKSVAAAVVSIHDVSLLRTGLPFDRFDLLVLGGPHVTVPADMGEQKRDGVVRDLLRAILPACTGKVITVAGSGLAVEAYEHLAPGQWVTEPVPSERLVDCVTREMFAADEQSKAPLGA